MSTESRPSVPVFLVGLPRSGTTLLTAMLSSHSRLASGPETQFFEKISKKEFANCLRDPHWPEQAVDAICQLTLVGEPVVELYGLSREDIQSYLEKHPPSIKSMLESLTVQFSSVQNKPRWIEKTPNHLKFVREIRANFPEAPIIRIIRDPRDSAVSMTKLPHTSDDPLVNLYDCRMWYDVSDAFLESDPLHYTVRYEDLIENPELTLRGICDFIGEEYENAMLHFAETSDQLRSDNEVWKKGTSKRLDPSRKAEWKKKLPPDLHAICSMLFAEYLKKFNYEVVAEANATQYVYKLDRSWVNAHLDEIVADADRGRRWLPTNDVLRASRNRLPYAKRRLERRFKAAFSN